MKKPDPLTALILAALLAVAAPPVAAGAQEPEAEEPPPPAATFGITTGAVALDVVVRDKKGRLVKDLTAEHFDVYEDGEKQHVDSFAVVARGVEGLPDDEAPEASVAAATTPAGPSPAEPAPPAPQTDGTPAVLALVFDRMSTEGRDMARKAALTYLSARHHTDFVAVFSIDLALHTVQSFTNEPARIRHAIALAATQAATPFTSSADQVVALQTLEGRALEAEARVTATTGGGGPGGTSGSAAARALAGGAAVEADFMSIQVDMARSFESLERDQQGLATTNSLLALVQGFQRVPGRKTIVFFSEGMAIPDRVQAQFHSVIAAANRANVAIYTMDAGGLRAHSPTEETRRQMMAANESRYRSLGREDAVGLMLPDAERNEDLLRLNPHSGLGQLADQTGGFFIRDTNDARGSFRRIAQDMRFHYVLGYTPTNDTYDGRFREISVKVARKGVDVHSRRGYFAVQPGGSSPVRAYEAPAVAVLDRGGPPPEAFPFHAVALTFPDDGTTAKVPVLVQVPGDAIRYEPEPSRPDSMVADLTIVVRVRNEYRQEVARLSQRYQLSSPADKLEAARAGDILFYREAELPPGQYTVDAVAYDASASSASVRSVPLEVSAGGAAGAQLSSLVLIDRVERVPAEERDSSNPLYFGEALLYPNMGDPYRKSVAKALGFFFSARAPGPSRRALLEVARAGQVTGSLMMKLPEPDADGRIQHAGTLPLESFAPGEYELRVSLLDGTRRVAATATPFSVAE